MGMHKHGVSGRVPTNKANALARAREVNRALIDKAAAKNRRKTPMVESVSKLFK